MHNNNIPQHVAMIMDGNGRWAKESNLPRTAGHREGVKRAKEIIAAAIKAKVKVLTLFAFSTENWSRPKRNKRTYELFKKFPGSPGQGVA